MQSILDLNKSFKIFLLLIIDFIICLFSLYLSICLRIESFFVPNAIEQYIFFFFSALILNLIFYFNLVYKNYTRFIDLFYIKFIFKILIVYSCIFFISVFILNIDNIPRSISLIYPAILITLILASRIIINLLYDYFINYNFKSQNIIIYGAGVAGNNLIKTLRYKKRIVGLIDDDIKKQGNYINNIKISSKDKIADLIKKYNVKEILFAISNLPRFKKKQIITALEKYKIKIQIVPDFLDIIEGNLKISDLLDPKLDNILGRDSVEPNEDLLKKNIENKIILITGAGGSIGKQLLHICNSLSPKKIFALDQNEHSLFELRKDFENINKKLKKNKIIKYLLVDLTHESTLKEILLNEEIDTIFHCAAYKHVSLVEKNKLASIHNNIISSFNVCKFAEEISAKNVVLISSDKAVKPINVMGLTKRFSEKIFQYFDNQNPKTNFTSVRFGNVLESSGSVIPIFREQIKKGGPVTVTDKKVKRFFMTIQEAAELVVQASSLSIKGGEVFVLKMGKEINIFSLAKKMINLSGLEYKDDKNPSGDIEIEITGLKDGEKISEDLFYNEDIESTDHPKVMKTKSNFLNLDKTVNEIELIKKLIKESDQIKLLNELKNICQ
tara:strand:+ start:26777 stop:28615 length:1839 start_codon:yes stop_codon:yes gene_type:complete